MKLNRRQWIIGSAAGLAAMGITRPTWAQNAAEGQSATGVPYVKKDQINGGKPIKLTYWEWVNTRAEYEKRWTEEYHAMYPNVEIEVVMQPWEQYFQALATNIPSGQPALYHMHTSRASQFCDSNLMAPIPSDVADPNYLKEHWVGFTEGALSCDDGSINYLPMGTQLPILLINTDMWTAAGLTDADIPKTWDQLRQAAIKLTQKDGRGRINVAGLSMIPQEYLQNAVYQQGRYLFTADTKHVQVQNPEFKKAVQFFSDLLHVDNAFDPALIDLQWNAFLGQKAAMYIGFSWIVGSVRPLSKDMGWIGVPMPTPSGDLKPAYGNMRFPVEASVNPYAPDDVKAVAWDFFHYTYSRPSNVLNDMALNNGFVPAYNDVLDAPAVADDPIMAALAPTMEYGIISDVPDAIRDEQNQLLEQVILDAADLDGKLAAAEQKMNAILAQRDSWPILERRYKHDDLMIPNQP
jgi:multiple sugar transport system substrate-binding protein